MQEPASDAVAAKATVMQPDLTSLVVPLLKGVLYREDDAAQWAALLQLLPRVRDYVAVLALELVVDEAEGYAFLRSQPQSDDTSPKLPRLVRRQPLSFSVSLLLALLRKKLAEFDASGGDTRLILTRSAVVELVRVFLPAGSNESRLIDQIETQLNKVIELGFVRRLKAQADSASSRASQEPVYEVRRILKAFVDAQWLADFDERLTAYQAQLVAPLTLEPDDE
ncbi:MAG: DUF4194 domain-containing protein [Rhodoferax sp.]|uniref:DUF4194 domain-containing protein n=1 Tax=Rhodoferax sp. TaxID=50421 RepID=UPI00262DB672|nr:DUF4194 domain-containing protein [Rhodoferax sp.]MDD2881414.1 DUF4194 domain-containing protein [Rhodoferax sp.]